MVEVFLHRVVMVLTDPAAADIGFSGVGRIAKGIVQGTFLSGHKG